jgi:hypothetical protein
MSRPRVAAPVLAFLCLVVIVIFSWTEQSSTQGSIYFRADFNTSSTNYSFGGRYPTGPWSSTHLATGGWNGTGGARIQMNAGQTQYNFGYWTPQFRTFAMGDSVYFRFRIRYEEGMRANEVWGNKFIMMGSGEGSRIIIYMQPPSESSGCSLAMRNWNVSGAPVYPWAIPAYFGILNQTTFDRPPLMPYSWSLAAKENIGWNCAPPIFQTIPSNPYNGRPGPVNSALPVNGWYHVQVFAQSGPAGGGAFKMWANNNNFNSPSSQQIGLGDGLGVVGWGTAVLGGYMDNATPSVNLGYTIDDFEIGSGFDANWYPGGAGTPPPPAPAAPTAVRILR